MELIKWLTTFVSLVRNMLVATMMYTLLVFCALAFASTSGATVNTRWTTNYNDNFDAVLNSVKKYGPELGLDPMKLPDINRTVSVNVLIGQISGGLVNTNGILTGATTLRRSGDATARINGDLVYIDADVDFVNLNYVYTSRAEFMGVGAGGKTEGVVNDLLLHLTLKIDMSNPTYADEELYELTIKSTGGLTVHFDNGMAILDQFIDAIFDVFTAAFKDVITNNVKPEMEKAVKYGIKKIEGSAR